MEIVHAEKNKAAEYYQCIEDARSYHKALGFEQWRPDYPTLQTILDDIQNGDGYAFTESGKIIGYCCIIIGNEKIYQNIDGKWKTDRPYAGVHRMAFCKEARGKGLSKAAFNLIKNICLKQNVRAIRLDTQEENKVMQHILSREGFSYCGLIDFNGGPKLAYEWDA